MHYVKQFNINGVDTKQVACIELQGKPNAATEGAIGLLGMDMSSPLHDVYKCVAVNGSIYTWELLSSGLSIMSATISGGGSHSPTFPYANLKTPATYVIKVGDLILDSEGSLYQIESLNSTYCVATYCGVNLIATTHRHQKSDITDFPTSMTPTAHNQSASTITAGTFAGEVVANSNGQTPGNSILRNSKLVSTEETPTVNGEICWTYK